MAIPEQYRPTTKKARRDFMCGFLGECSLRELRYFDVGRSFAFDTLHNLYRGTFVSILVLKKNVRDFSENLKPYNYLMITFL